MTNNFHDLITRMANELDEYRRLLLDDCTVTHRLSNEARAALADEPAAPTPPADGEVAELVEWLRETGDLACQADAEEGQRYWSAAELLERLSPPQPVPVSERLPGPEDCDAEGRCWWFAPETEVDFGGWTFGTTEICANSQWVDWENTHWLPAHDLPVPEVGE